MHILNDLKIITASGRQRAMNHAQLCQALGLNPRKHLPDEGLPPRVLGNVLVWVVPRVPGTSQDARRTWCECPHCRKQLTAGKLQQHLKVHRFAC
jgi:hypothetical protein